MAESAKRLASYEDLMQVPPLLVAEILAGKLVTRAGVDYLWLLDPDLRTLEVYGLESGRWVLLECHRDDARVAPPPFGAVAIDLRDLWA